jgi:hypothetical protein
MAPFSAPGAMPKICISYRRSDSEGITGRIFDRLVSQYGRDSIFRDIDSVPAGTDFREHVRQMLTTTDVLLVIVGPKWTGTRRGGGARINEETDLVRIEVATGLTNGMVVVPILVGDTKMPSDDLPPSLRDFAFRNAMRVDPGVDFDQHMQRLIRAIDGLLAQRSEIPPAVEAPLGPAEPPRAAVASPSAQNAPKAPIAATAPANAQHPPALSAAKPRRSAWRWLWRTAAVLAILIVALTTVVWVNATVARLENEINLVAVRSEAIRAEFRDALAKQAGLTPEDLKRLGDATVYVKDEWYLYDHLTRKVLYQRMTRIDGELLPCFVKLDDGSVVRWLTLDDQGGLNRALGVNQGGSGFVVDEQGFILTNRRYAAGWTMPYEDLPPNGPWRGAVFAFGKTDQQAGAPEVRDVSKERALTAWIPANGGYVFEAARPTAISPGPRQLYGQNDLLTAQFPGTRLPITAHLLRTPASADIDVALVKIDSTQALSKLELNSTDYPATMGDKAFMFSYEPVQQTIVYDPILTEGIVIKTPVRDPDGNHKGNYEFESIALPRSGGGPVLNSAGKVFAVLLNASGGSHGAVAVSIGDYVREIFQPQRNASP